MEDTASSLFLLSVSDLEEWWVSSALPASGYDFQLHCSQEGEMTVMPSSSLIGTSVTQASLLWQGATKELFRYYQYFVEIQPQGSWRWLPASRWGLVPTGCVAVSSSVKSPRQISLGR